MTPFDDQYVWNYFIFKMLYWRTSGLYNSSFDIFCLVSLVSLSSFWINVGNNSFQKAAVLFLNPNSTLGWKSRTRIACSSSVNSGHVNFENAEFSNVLGSLRMVENKRKTWSMDTWRSYYWEKLLNRSDIGLFSRASVDGSLLYLRHHLKQNCGPVKAPAKIYLHMRKGKECKN